MPDPRGGPRGREPQHHKVSPARWAAFDVLQQVETTSAHSDDLLHGPALRKLSQADRNLTTALVMGVLRWQIALDAELDALLDRPDQPLPVPARLALRLGAFQLRYMDRIPAHAALSESVELVRVAGQIKAVGLVNAVLRKLVSRPPLRKPIVESLESAATRLGHPAWLVRRWAANYGRTAAVAISEYDQSEPAEGHLFAREDEPQASSEAHEFAVELLDDGSRLVAEITAASHQTPRRIWDACAAPGGKTTVLARRHADAELLATDISPRRLQAMQRRLARELPNRDIRAIEADAAKLPVSEGSFDLILCDVPCSGTGTLARNPEIRHRVQPADLSRQAKRQRDILTAALSRLNPGGRLVYSTCSLEPEENEAVVQSVLDGLSGFTILPIEQMLAVLTGSKVLKDDKEALPGIAREGMLRTLPGANFQVDGFFAAVIERER